MAQTVHVFRTADGWMVRGGEGSRGGLHGSRAAALAKARAIARSHSPSQVVVHGKVGQISETLTFGKLPTIKDQPGKGKLEAAKIRAAVREVVRARLDAQARREEQGLQNTHVFLNCPFGSGTDPIPAKVRAADH